VATAAAGVPGNSSSSSSRPLAASFVQTADRRQAGCVPVRAGMCRACVSDPYQVQAWCMHALATDWLTIFAGERSLLWLRIDVVR
jgi:hypothetical protein